LNNRKKGTGLLTIKCLHDVGNFTDLLMVNTVIIKKNILLYRYQKYINLPRH